MNVSSGKIKLMQKERSLFLLKYIMINYTNNDENKAMQILYSTKTFKLLQDFTSDFYWKSKEELIYLLQVELKGNENAWVAQAF